MKIIMALLACLPLLSVQAQVDHGAFNKLLNEHVDISGGVNYKNLREDSSKLNRYIEALEINVPQKEWSQEVQLTYWINAYNALTLQLVLKYYPINSIKDIGSTIQIPYFNTPWDIELFNYKGKQLSLNNIEHNIIREDFEEPRIHFALVCAAVSCPSLRNEAYDPTRLNEQLSDQSTLFLADKSKNMVGEKKLILSKLFNWYGGDFRKNGSIVDFISPYAEVAIDAKAKISFMDYNWDLNEQE